MTKTFIENGVKKFICEECGNTMRIDTMTECSNCGTWYEMEIRRIS